MGTEDTKLSRTSDLEVIVDQDLGLQRSVARDGNSQSVPLAVNRHLNVNATSETPSHPSPGLTDSIEHDENSS